MAEAYKRSQLKNGVYINFYRNGPEQIVDGRTEFPALDGTPEIGDSIHGFIRFIDGKGAHLGGWANVTESESAEIGEAKLIASCEAAFDSGHCTIADVHRSFLP